MVAMTRLRGALLCDFGPYARVLLHNMACACMRGLEWGAAAAAWDQLASVCRVGSVKGMICP